ncbi:MAG TPA: pyridoxal phosphate-dependent class II aminotransferase, partial [Thauera aminoaromatica]|nr:pyridoxal phosphate-dependent class II aminotransferase [Thauera aminoaromatica]
MLEHGGRLRRAAEHYGIALADWMDLSTGISPWAYPVPPVPETAWQRLPEDDDGLEEAAARYYGSAELLAVAGSQPAIQALPAVLPGARVRLLAPGYAEHAHAWRERRPRSIDAEEVEGAIDDSDVVVLVQPNNPTGVHFDRDRLLDWHARLARRGGWLVVDEAFADTTPAHSLVPLAGRPGLVVLRSLGKFFGLAGARVGFVFAPTEVRTALAERLGPWTLAGPARWAAHHALADEGILLEDTPQGVRW